MADHPEANVVMSHSTTVAEAPSMGQINPFAGEAMRRFCWWLQELQN